MGTRRTIGVAAACLAAVLVITTAGPAGAATDPATVVTDKGPVTGTVADGYRTFRGIPYAAPPVGPLRWTPPREPAAWSAPRDARPPSPACPQTGAANVSEDCLTVDVTTPAAASGKRPVIVYLHGGAFVRGSAGTYDTSRMATRGDVVVVTVNYRLGALGFLADDRIGPDSNFGLQDQIAALRWVQRNAAAFGGDPANVTAEGGSAGGLSICSHVSSGVAPELFGRAIVQSAPCGAPFRTRAQGLADAPAFARNAGCTGPDAVACLRALPADEVVAAQNGITWQPTVGDRIVREQPRDVFAAGRIARIPMMLGNNRDEARFSVGTTYDGKGMPVTAEQYPVIIRKEYGAAADRVLATYPLRDYPTPSIALATVETDYQDVQPPIAVCPTLTGERAASRVTPVHAYEFADRTAPPRTVIPGFPSGAQHTSELQYLFGDGDAGAPLDGTQRALGDRMIDYWTSFARTGEPRSAGAPAWPAFHGSADVLAFGPRIGTVDLSAEHRCDFWRSTTGVG